MLYLVSFVVMEDQVFEDSSSSVFVELEYESSLSAGLDTAQYYLSKSVKESTKKQYTRVYDIWTDFCRENDVPEFGATHTQLAACLSLVMMQEGSYSKTVMLSAAIAHQYRIRMLPSPTVHESISLLFRGFRNEHPQTRTPKSPMTEEILLAMYTYLYRPENGRDGLRASVVLWRTIWRIAMEYHTLGRFSDIVKLQKNDVIYKPNPSPHLRVMFKGGKNDQYSEGSERIIASNSNEKICPIKLTLNYFQFLGLSYSGYLVPLCTSKNAPNPNKPVSYSAALSDLKKLLQLLGFDPNLYGEHSGKRGGATAAAAHGATESQLKRLGGWRSDAMPSKYVDLSLPTRISMSEMLQNNSQ